MTPPIHRVTLFKISNEEDQNRLLLLYKQMKQTALKDGKPYIQSVTAGPTKLDQRAQGYTFAAISVFSSEDDMVYYDNKCTTHAELKAFAKGVHNGALMVYF